MTYTYFIQAGSDGLIKIGRAANPATRLAELQTASPDDLWLLGVVEGNYERVLHQAFEHIRVRGEWFEPHIELRSFIDRYAMPINPQQAIKRAAQIVVDAHKRMKDEIMEVWFQLAANTPTDGECQWPHLKAFDESVAMLELRLRPGDGTHYSIDDSPQIKRLNYQVHGQPSAGGSQ